MAKVEPLLFSLNSGEFSPRMEARVDLESYPNAAKRMNNCTLFPQGGFTRRPGSRFVKEVKASANQTYMFGFEYSEDDSYVIEAGDLYMRFYRRQGQITIDETDAVVTNGAFGSNITGWDDISTGSRSQNVSITSDNPGLVSWAYNDLPNASPVVFTTTGTLPSNITAGVTYYTLRRTKSTFRISATPLGAAIDTSGGSPSGTHTATVNASVAWSSANNNMELIGAENSIAWAEQDITVGASYQDNPHVLRFEVVGNCNGKVGFQVGTATGLSDILSEVELDIGYHSIAFTPGATTFYVQFRNSFQTNKVSRTLAIDNVSLMGAGADVPLELTTLYTTAALANVRTQQTGDVLYLFDGASRIKLLERRGHTSWSIVSAPFDDGPWNDVNPDTDLDGNQLLFNPFFEGGLAGWTEASTGDGFVQHSAASDFAEMDPGTSGGSGIAKIQEAISALPIPHVLHAQLLNVAGVDLFLGAASPGAFDILDGTNSSAGWISYGFTPSAGDVHIEFSYNKYNQDRAGVGACLVYDSRSKLIELSSIKGLVTLTARGTDFEPFVASDVGRQMRLQLPGVEPAWGCIVSYTSATEVGFLFIRDLVGAGQPGSILTDQGPVYTETWQLGAWNDTDGYPKTIGFFDGRSLFANTSLHPQRVWASQSGDLLNLRPDSWVGASVTVEDDDAIDVTLNATRINQITWFSGQKQLLTGTAGGQWVGSSSGEVIAPNDISFKQHTFVPNAKDLDAAQVNQISLFADKSKREVYDAGFRLDEDTFVATDITIFADHIFHSPIEQLEYQRRPYSLLQCRKKDGHIASLSFNKQHNVLGWTHWEFGGSFGAGHAFIDSMTVIPGANDSNQTFPSDERDELWVIAKRTQTAILNGAFTEDADWTKGTGWTIASGVATSDASQVGDADLTQTVAPLVSGTTYTVTFTVSGMTAGNITPVCGTQEGTDRSANGTYVEDIVCNGTAFHMRADLNFDGSIDNVKVDATTRYVEFMERYYDAPLREDYETEALWRQAVQSDQANCFNVDSGLTLKVPLTITGATKANPVVITSTAHGLADDEEVIIHDVEGMTELNGNTYTVANKTANTFELNDNEDSGGVDGSAYTTYISGGKAYKKVTSITGLEHLEGETVKILADGKVLPDGTVSSGAITLPSAAGVVQVGLAYKSEYESLKMAVGGTQGSTAVNKIKMISSMGLILIDTGKFKLTTIDYDESGRRQHDLYEVSFQRTDLEYGQPVPLYTGEHEESTEGSFSTDARLYIETDNPVPFSLIGVVPRVETFES